MKIKILQARPAHEVVYQDLCALVNRHAAKMTSVEILAVAANMVGKLLALQDQRTMTKDMALDVIIKNIEYGNQQVLNNILNNTGGSA